MFTAVLSCAGSLAMAADTATLPGHVAAWINTATRVGPAPDAQRVAIVVHMALRNPAALKQLVSDVSKPGSSKYGQYLTPAQLAAQFAPDPADVSEIAGMMAGAGFSNLQTGPDGAYISAVATVAQLNAAFGITQTLYTYQGQTLRGISQQPTVPASVAGKIVYIEGLDDTTFLKQPMHQSAVAGDMVAPAASADAAATPGVTPPPVAANLPSPYCATYYNDTVATLSTPPAPYPAKLSWLICGYTPQQIQAAYGFDQVKFDGTGITVAIIDAFASPTLMADGNRYAKNHNLPALTSKNFSQIFPLGIYDVPAAQVTNAYGWWGEQSLDLAAVHGSAPGANIVYIGSTDNGSSLTTALFDAIYNKKADIITNSYSYNGESTTQADITAQDQAFMAAAAMGITILFSSGDDGDLSQLNGVATGAYASTSPYVIGVGGTSLGVFDKNGSKAEAGWGTYRAYLSNAKVNSASSITTSGVAQATVLGTVQDAYTFYAGGGGGISVVEPQPDYQIGVVPTALATQLNQGVGYYIPVPPRRVSPDVSMVADPYTGYLIGETFTIAGNPVTDAGCTPLTATTEYCEIPFGGTSLASPLMAGVAAVVNQSRIKAGLPMVGFANPLLYATKTGATLTSTGFNQVLPPGAPTAVLRGYANDATRVRVITINSVPTNAVATPFPLQVCGLAICEGLDDVFNVVTPGYNDVTGLGVPWLPGLVAQ